MKPLFHWAARIYPRSWRTRYGAEFSALLEETPFTAAAFADVLWKGVTMQLSAKKVTLTFAAAGLALGLAFWAARDPKFSTQMTVAPAADTNSAIEAALTRRELSRLIQELDLYHAERHRVPMEEVITLMRGDIHLQNTPNGPLTLGFRYPDAQKSERAAAWLAGMVGRPISKSGPVPISRDLPTALTMALAGAAFGLLIALLFRPKARRLVLCSILGAAVGYTLAFWMPGPYRSMALIRTDQVRTPMPPGLRMTNGLAATSLILTYEHTDRYAAQRALIEAIAAIQPVAILDPPCLPATPATHRQFYLTLLGLALGLLLARPKKQPA